MARPRPPRFEAEARSPDFVASLPFSEACERNKGPILEVLRRHLAMTRGIVLEVGAGTGQHAVHLARHLPGLTWQPTEQAAHLAMLSVRVAAEKVPNLLLPRELDVAQRDWPCGRDAVDAVFTANTFHIMAWPQVQAFFRGTGEALRPGGLLLVYGPFRYAGQYTSHSNHTFDDALRARDPASGIRDFEAVDELAAAQGMLLLDDAAMPANNQLLVWRRRD
jgi:cyclopropane fatty-acyl-phospholipid synthase-like methyltransferase